MSKERPILFSAPMVRALLEGRKTQTRRIMKAQPHWSGTAFGIPGLPSRTGFYANTEEGFKEDLLRSAIKCPYGVPGDRLWVKEACRFRLDQDHLKPSELDPKWAHPTYVADFPDMKPSGCGGGVGRYRHARFMPRWASRITLEITDVRVQRVQEITEEDAKAEGFIGEWGAGCAGEFLRTFYDLNKRAPRTENPWVWAISFRKVSQ